MISGELNVTVPSVGPAGRPNRGSRVVRAGVLDSASASAYGSIGDAFDHDVRANGTLDARSLRAVLNRGEEWSRASPSRLSEAADDAFCRSGLGRPLRMSSLKGDPGLLPNDQAGDEQSVRALTDARVPGRSPGHAHSK